MQTQWSPHSRLFQSAESANLHSGGHLDSTLLQLDIWRREKVVTDIRTDRFESAGSNSELPFFTIHQLHWLVLQ